MVGIHPSKGIDRFLRHVTIERGLSLNTQTAYRSDLSAYADWLSTAGIDDLSDVQPATLASFVASLNSFSGTEEEQAAAYSSQTITRRMSTVRGLHRFLFDEGILESYAGSGLRTPKVGKRLPKALSIEQVDSLFAATIEETPVGIRDRAVLELLYASGARVSELTALDIDDLLVSSQADQGESLDASFAWLLQGGFLRVTGKGSKQRVVPYGSYAGKALAAYLTQSRPVFTKKSTSTPAIFVGPRGGRMNRQTVWEIIRRAAEKAGLVNEVSPHTMRHSFATHLLSGGADVRSVQELLGHASVETTQIYTQVSNETLREHYLSAHPRAR